MMTSLLCLVLSQLDVLPPHLRGGSIGSSQPSPPTIAVSAQYVEVPLDHFDLKGPTWQLKFFVDDTAYGPGGALLVTMPSEGATSGCYAGELAKALRAVAVCSQHRYFGDSVPRGDSTTAALVRYMSVEQNLADIAALIHHVRGSLYPAVNATVVQGGSYAGASSAWMRQAYPHLVDAAIAQSPPVTATLGFPEYDTSNLVALSSPDSRCATTQARVADALTSLLEESPAELMALFNASHYAAAPLGMTDFMYALGDSAASAVQYGRKDILCAALAPLHTRVQRLDEDERWRLAEAFANFTYSAWGTRYFEQCFYNSTCMQSATRGATAESARSWYFLKCSQLGYLQSAPDGSSLSTRPRQLSVARLLEQCAYIFGDDAPLLTPAAVDAFNARHGAGTLGGVSRLMVIDYSDDPWKMASTVAAVTRQAWPMSIEQPFMLLTCDGCAHCGAGVPAEKARLITEQIFDALASWGVSVWT